MTRLLAVFLHPFQLLQNFMPKWLFIFEWHEVNMQNLIKSEEIVIIENEKPLTTTLHIADGTNGNHRAIIQLIRTHIHHFNRFGRVQFEMRPFETNGGVQLKRIALLNEQQATFLMTLMRNTEKVVEFKCVLVEAFFKTKEYLNNKSWDLAQIYSKLTTQLDLEKSDASLAGSILGSYKKKRDLLIDAINEVEKAMQPCLAFN